MRGLPLILLLLGTGCGGAPGDDDDSSSEVDDDDSGTPALDDDDSSIDDDDTPPSSDLDRDGYSVEDGDCDDNNGAVHPGVEGDGCDGLDNDCDGDIDEDPEERTGLPPGLWTSDDAHAQVVDPTGEWKLGSVHAARGTESSTVIVRAARWEDGFLQETGNLVFGPPACPKTLAPVPADAFILGSSGFMTGPRFDLNADGFADSFVQNRIYLGPHVGDLGSDDADFTLPFAPTGLDAADLDGDGYNDLVATTYGSEIAAFWRGPLIGPNLALEDAVGVEAPVSGTFFGETATILPVPGEEAVTLISAPRQAPSGEVHYVVGFPEPGQLQPDGMLDLSPWYDPTVGWWGRGLATDGESRACIGHALLGPGPVGCGTWAELLSGTPATIIGPVNNGEFIDMTPELIAVGEYEHYEPGGDPFVTGQLHIRSRDGAEWRILCASYEECSGSFGLGLALFPDLVDPAITWLAARGRFATYFFALDTSGL